MSLSPERIVEILEDRAPIIIGTAIGAAVVGQALWDYFALSGWMGQKAQIGASNRALEDRNRREQYQNQNGGHVGKDTNPVGPGSEDMGKFP